MSPSMHFRALIAAATLMVGAPLAGASGPAAKAAHKELPGFGYTGPREDRRIALTFAPGGGWAKPLAPGGGTAVQFDLPGADSTFDKKTLVKWVVGKAKPGSIVVLHMNGHGKHTADALPEIVATLRKQGYQFATVGQL